MRMRKKKHGAERIEACGELRIAEPSVMLNGFENIFGNDAPVHMEIGCGKGNFACGMAKANPDVNFVAVERVADVCCIALEKAKKSADERPNDNLRFMIGDARTLAECVKPHSLECIYLNFSDPWPKTRHEKNRLTSSTFMPLYIKLLKEHGELHQKTDNRGLFDFSLEVYKEYGCTLSEISYDLHKDGMEGNVVTEYEQRFVDLGQPIHRVVVTMPNK